MYLPNGHPSSSMLIGMSGKMPIVNTVQFFNLVPPEDTQPNPTYSLRCYIHLRCRFKLHPHRGHCVLELGQGEQFVSFWG